MGKKIKLDFFFFFFFRKIRHILPLNLTEIEMVYLVHYQSQCTKLEKKAKRALMRQHKVSGILVQLTQFFKNVFHGYFFEKFK